MHTKELIKPEELRQATELGLNIQQSRAEAAAQTAANILLDNFTGLAKDAAAEGRWNVSLHLGPPGSPLTTRIRFILTERFKAAGYSTGFLSKGDLEVSWYHSNATDGAGPL